MQTRILSTLIWSIYIPAPNLSKLMRSIASGGTLPRTPNTGISRMEMYLTSSNPATPAITEEDMVSMLWWTTEQPVAYTDNGLTVTINGEKRKYEVHERPGVYDYDFRPQPWPAILRQV